MADGGAARELHLCDGAAQAGTASALAALFREVEATNQAAITHFHSLFGELSAMKYMLLIYTEENSYTDGERQECYVESTELLHDLNARGQYLAANPLQSVTTATSVRVRNGKRLVTDGPFAETREQLGGYFLVEATDLNEAISIAGRIPGARKGTVEVRPVVELPGLPRVAKQLGPLKVDSHDDARRIAKKRQLETERDQS